MENISPDEQSYFADGLTEELITRLSRIQNLKVRPRTDVAFFKNKIAPMKDELYIHNTEGKDDMPAHIKSSLTNNQLSLSVKNGELLLGTWQGLYLFEHRLENQDRKIIHHFVGE